MLSGGGPGLQSREGGNRIVPGGFDSHPFRFFYWKSPYIAKLLVMM